MDADIQATVDEVIKSTLPSSARMDGMVFDLYTLNPEFYNEISETSPYPLSKIETPMLVISTLDDPVAVPENVRGLSEKFPHARLFVSPDGGHLTLGHTKEVKAEITQFLHSRLAMVNSSQ